MSLVEAKDRFGSRRKIECEVYQCDCGSRAFRIYTDGVLMCAMCDNAAEDWPTLQELYEAQADSAPIISPLPRLKGGQDAD